MHESLVGLGANVREIHISEAGRCRWLWWLHGDRAGFIGHAASRIPHGMLQLSSRRPTSRSVRVSCAIFTGHSWKNNKRSASLSRQDFSSFSLEKYCAESRRRRNRPIPRTTRTTPWIPMNWSPRCPPAPSRASRCFLNGSVSTWIRS